MSNVLIGIIGVILFIGLAVAGALFLGDQFKNVAGKSNGTVIIGQLQQMTQAVEMYRLKTGVQTVTCQTVDFLVPRFLKSVPTSPTLRPGDPSTSYYRRPQLNNDLIVDATPEQAAGHPALYITTNIGNDRKAKDACQAIADTQNRGVPTVTVLPTEKSGCGLFNDEYVAWIRI